MGNKMKLGICSAFLVSGLVSGTLGTGDLIAHANENNVSAYETIANSPFKDVTTDHYTYKAIVWAKDKGIVSGFKDGTFKPNNSITEAQFSKMLAEFLNIADDKGNLLKLTSDSHWADGYYDSLAAYGTPLNAYFDNTLRNIPIKRGVVAQAISHLTGNASSLSDSINFMLGVGITTGQNPQFEGKDLTKFFGSSNNLTRAQVAVFLYRMHNSNINEATGIALQAHNNKEGLSLVDLANKGMSKLDNSLRLGKSGSEVPVDFEDSKAYEEYLKSIGVDLNPPPMKEININDLNNPNVHHSEGTLFDD